MAWGLWCVSPHRNGGLKLCCVQFKGIKALRFVVICLGYKC